MRLYAGRGFVVKHDLGDRLHMHCDLMAAGPEYGEGDER